MTELDSAKARVAEFVRQWMISYSAEDKVYEVHFDPAMDEGAALRISDLKELLK